MGDPVAPEVVRCFRGHDLVGAVNHVREEVLHVLVRGEADVRTVVPDETVHHLGMDVPAVVGLLLENHRVLVAKVMRDGKAGDPGAQHGYGRV